MILDPTHLVPLLYQLLRRQNKNRKATNISGMDVGPSRVVVCSADTAWYYGIRQASGALQHQQDPREDRSQSQSQQRRVHPSQDEAGTAVRREGTRGDTAEFTLEASLEAGRGAAVSPASVRGIRLPSPCVTEARFSGDGERCFFGSMSGDVYVVSPVGSRRVPSARTRGVQDKGALAACLAFPHQEYGREMVSALLG